MFLTMRRPREGPARRPVLSRGTDVAYGELRVARQPLELDDGAHFDRAEPRARDALGDGDRLVEISGVDEEEPPSCSRVSAKGPSVMSGLPLRTRTLVAVDVG